MSSCKGYFLSFYLTVATDARHAASTLSVKCLVVYVVSLLEPPQPLAGKIEFLDVKFHVPFLGDNSGLFKKNVVCK